eukprot:6188778-Pleurochrysis_carterae.AAC.4
MQRGTAGLGGVSPYGYGSMDSLDTVSHSIFNGCDMNSETRVQARFVKWRSALRFALLLENMQRLKVTPQAVGSATFKWEYPSHQRSGSSEFDS